MQDFELLRNVTIGQYIPTDSVVHRLDPRAKLLATLFLVLAISSTRSIVASTILIGFLLLIAWFAHISPLYVLRGLLPGLGFIIFLFVMQVLFQGSVVPCNTVYFEWWFIRITPCILQLVVLGALRVVVFLFIISLLTMTTTSSYLTHGIEILLSPFQRIGLPTHEIALANMIALRFIPTLAEELERIMKAQASRGASIGATPWWRPDLMARERMPLLVPLFVNALRRGEDLVLAMEARCYMGGKGRTKFVQFHSKPLDWVVGLGALAIFLGAWLIPWPAISSIVAPL
jgi:energy-coupling factor transport system permease protein